MTSCLKKEEAEICRPKVKHDPFTTKDIIFKRSPKCCLETNFREMLPIRRCDEGATDELCGRLRHFKDLSVLLQNVLNVTETIINIMQYCGIHKCLAEKASDIIIYSFVHFEENDKRCECEDESKPKKRLHKEQFICELRRNLLMTKAQAELTYKITKSAFDAFYYRQVTCKFDEMWFDEYAWKRAAQRTVTAFKEQEHVNEYEINKFRENVDVAYKKYLERRKKKMEQPIYRFNCCCVDHCKPKPKSEGTSTKFCECDAPPKKCSN